jgi:hypothetical protein
MRPFAAAALLALFLGSGCDFSFSLSVGSDDGLSSASADVISDPATDGFVRQDGAVVTTSAILCGVDAAAPPPFPEDRGFLSFPLGGIPPGAFIESATVTFHVDRVDLLPGSANLVLTLDHVQYGDLLSFPAFSAAGAPVRGFLLGVRLVPSPGAQRVFGDIVPELQADVDDTFLRFFQLRLMGTGGVAQIVDGGGNRAGGAPRDVSLVPVLSVRYRF